MTFARNLLKTSLPVALCAAQLDRAGGALLLPYAGWTAFATVLTARIDQVN